MSRLNKNLQSKKKEKKRHMYMFTLSQKTIKRPNFWALPNSYLTSLPPFLMCFRCCVVTKHTGGNRFCVMASESFFCPHDSLKWTTVCFYGMKAKIWTVAVAVTHVHFRVCGTEHGGQTGRAGGRAITEPTLGTAVDLSHFKACNKHTNVQLARTISITRF